MTDVNANRGVHRPTSTEILEEACELSQTLKEGEGKELEWHADHAVMETRRQELKGTPDAVAKGRDVALAGAKYFGKKAKDEAIKELKTNGVRTGFQNIKGTVINTLKAEATKDVAMAGAMIAAGALQVYGLFASMSDGDELKHLSDLDAIDVATVSLLNLNEDFKNADLAKHPSIVPSKLVNFMQNSEFGKAHLPEMQAEADEGMMAAFAALRVGGREEMKRQHAEFASRLDGSVAFNKGFESVMWSASQPDGEERVAALKKEFDLRHPRPSEGTAIRG